MALAADVVDRSGIEHFDADLFRTVRFVPMPALVHAIVKRRAAGITIGRTVLIAPDVYEEVVAGHRPDLVAHELTHALQWQNDRWTFVVRYLIEYVRLRMLGAPHEAAYRSISYEIEAYEVGGANAMRAL